MLNLTDHEPTTNREDECAITEGAWRENLIQPQHYERNGKTVAVIGAGPAGLVAANKRKLVARAGGFPLEVLYLRDDDIPQSVATGVADIGVVGENEFVERGEDAEIISRLGFSKCRLSLAIPKEIEYNGLEWFNGKKIATSYPGILRHFMENHGIKTEIHVITG